MITNPQLKDRGEEEQSTTSALPLFQTSKSRIIRRHLLNKLANYLVSLGGFLLILTVVAIIVVMLVEFVPLFKSAYVSNNQLVPGASLSEKTLVLGVNEYREITYSLDRDGVARFIRAGTGDEIFTDRLELLNGATITSTSSTDGRHYLIGTSDGRVVPLEFHFSNTFSENGRKTEPSLEVGEPIVVDPQRGVVLNAVAVPSSTAAFVAAQIAPRALSIVTTRKSKALIGEGKNQRVLSTLTVDSKGEIASLAVDDRLDCLIVGTKAGELITYSLADSSMPQERQRVIIDSNREVSVQRLQFLLGDRTLIVTDSAGGVSSWMMVKQEGSNREELRKIHVFTGHEIAVNYVARSARSRTFFTADSSGVVQMHYSTTGETLLRHQLADSIIALGVGARGDGLVVASSAGNLRILSIHSPHPEISIKSLFYKVWYEGYSGPTYVWQSTGGTDDFEPKFSLPPLIFGTLKGTFYALLLAVPLAVLGALYTSQFMHPRLKAVIKPSVELMAALPSVVIGFIAGLWLAPRVDSVIAGVLLSPLVLPLVTLGALWILRAFFRGFLSAIPSGMEIVLLIPITVFGLYLSFSIGALIEHYFLGGNFASWVFGAFDVVYDQRNSVVVGLAMGFAVIPIIFTIAEDSLASVPKPLAAASLALGASKWATARRVVLPAALPGVFSAIMIGFGRAVGETMIVLMATGNTPVFDFTPFNGFRAMSANIAVELPEAPEGGSLYRVLFFSAFLLFCLTFVINTATELVRIRLRSRYKNL